jgi:hypothetical protein
MVDAAALDTISIGPTARAAIDRFAHECTGDIGAKPLPGSERTGD